LEYNNKEDSMKSKKLKPKAPEDTALRCYKCDFEWRAIVNINDKLYEWYCPNCKKCTVELNLGK